MSDSFSLLGQIRSRSRIYDGVQNLRMLLYTDLNDLSIEYFSIDSLIYFICLLANILRVKW